MSTSTFLIVANVAAFIASGMLLAQSDDPKPEQQLQTGSARDEALEKLLNQHDTLADLEKDIAAAREAGIPEQTLFEARFLFHLDRNDDKAVAAMAPEFVKRAASFDLGESAIFSVREEWLGAVEFSQAVAALESGEKDAFKKHITEAFWLSPAQATQFAPYIERMRMSEQMATLTLDFDRRFSSLSDGKSRALAEAAKDAKAVLIHFWSPWSRECEVSMQDFVTTVNLLASHGIGVISMLPEAAPNQLVDAREMLAKQQVKAGLWLIDQADDSLARRLRIQNLPQVVLLTTQGKVLFNGHPADDAMWRELARIDGGIVRPAVAEDAGDAPEPSSPDGDAAPR